MGQIRDGDPACFWHTVSVILNRTVYINGARVDGVTEMTVDQLTTLLANLI